VKKNPQSTKGYLRLAQICQHKLKDYSTAIFCYKALVALEPRSPNAYFELGQIYSEFKDLDKAMHYFK